MNFFIISGPDLGPNCLQRQTTPVGKELMQLKSAVEYYPKVDVIRILLNTFYRPNFCIYMNKT